MLNLKNLGRAVAATLLGAGLFFSAGVDPATAGGGAAAPVWSESGFDFTIFDGSGGVSGGVLNVCPGCFEAPVLLSITRSDEASFSMTGFEAGSVDVPFPIVVSDSPFGSPLGSALLEPPTPPFPFHPIGTPPVFELFVFPEFLDSIIAFEELMRFDSMSFDVFFDFGPIDAGPQLAVTESITVTFEAPEPGALALFGIGLAGLVAIRRRRRALTV
jgi:hypothetical protein